MVDIPVELINELQYLVERKHFIKPVHMGRLTESTLAKDFNFGEYLAFKHAKVVREHFETRFLTMLNCLPLLMIFIISISMEATEWNVLDYPWLADKLDYPLVISSDFFMNVPILVAFALSVSAFWYINSDLDRISKALFP